MEKCKFTKEGDKKDNELYISFMMSMTEEMSDDAVFCGGLDIEGDCKSSKHNTWATTTLLFLFSSKIKAN